MKIEKTALMKTYEKETGEKPEKYVMVSVSVDGYDYGELVYDEKYVKWLETRATGKGNLTSGDKKTLKELANFVGNAVAIDEDGSIFTYSDIPVLRETGDAWSDVGYWYGAEEYPIFGNFINFTGDWKTSLTLPDGWEEK